MRLSILIPTKDRYETLLPVLRALTSHITAEGVEIVVQDNSTAPDAAVASEIRMLDRRIVYHHDPQPLSIVDNTVRGIENCRGEYLTFIGDDDFVSPYICDFVSLLERTGHACLVFTPARYWWSTVVFSTPTRAHRPMAFWLPSKVGGPARVMNSAAEMDRLLAQGGLTYSDMPRFYHGLVHRSALEAIRERTGTYLPGSSPDMAFSVALALVCPEYLYVDYPVTVFGASRNSGGGRTAQQRHHGRIEAQSHLPKDILSRWDPMVPRVWSEQTIYPQTIREVLDRFGSDRRIAYEMLYASMMVNESYLMRDLWPCVRHYYARHPQRLVRLPGLLVKKAGGRLYRHLRSQSQLQGYDLHQFPDVASAMDFMRDAILPPERCVG